MCVYSFKFNTIELLTLLKICDCYNYYLTTAMHYYTTQNHFKLQELFCTIVKLTFRISSSKKYMEYQVGCIYTS